ncbi:MAG: hypothetical protein KDE55_16185 [Novosphingobium sp.]|nr:hypothetical protein [Novosphingobium sp.]
MKRALAPIAMLVLIPAMTGSLVASSAANASVVLCNGGSVSIPMGPSSPPGGENAPCCAKGCHTGQSRKRLDRAQ